MIDVLVAALATLGAVAGLAFFVRALVWSGGFPVPSDPRRKRRSASNLKDNSR